MSDEVALPDEVDDAEADADTRVVDALNDSFVREDMIRSTEDLTDLADIHAQAAANRMAMSPIGNDPTIVTAGLEGIPAPGPGPEPTHLGIPPDLATLNPEPEPIGPVIEEERREANAALAAHTAGEEYVAGEADDGSYDPGDYTVAEVNDYIAEHPDEADAIYEAEAAGKNRSGIVG